MKFIEQCDINKVVERAGFTSYKEGLWLTKFITIRCEKLKIKVARMEEIGDGIPFSLLENLTQNNIEEIINKEKSRNGIPELSGVKVYVVSAGKLNIDRFFAVQNFWLRYFKECGANLSKENYGSALLNFNE